jgi:flagellar hook-basal body complex protein FliE
MENLQMNVLRAELKAGAALAAGKTGTIQQAQQQAPAGLDFSAALRGAIGEVNGAQVKSATLTQEFQAGNPNVSLEETMVSLQKASLSFQFLLQVRNKVVSAYHDVMNMQV